MAESDIEKDRFLAEHADFRFREQVCYPNGGISRFYDNGTDMVVIDDGICSHEPKEPVFPYMLITEKQNDYMHRFQRVFRFLGYARENLDSYLAKDGIVLEGGYIRNTGDRSEQADASPLEIHFEENFSSVYGMNALRYLTREYGICDENGRNYFLDYFVRTKDQKYAIEENGLDYHHPQIIGEEKYRNQLKKQNTCALWGIKLFRFSKEDCEFASRIEDDIKQYFGKDSSNFVDDGIKVERKVELYEHHCQPAGDTKAQRCGYQGIFDCAAYSSGKIENCGRRFTDIRGRKTKVSWTDSGSGSQSFAGLGRKNKGFVARVKR